MPPCLLPLTDRRHLLLDIISARAAQPAPLQIEATDPRQFETEPGPIDTASQAKTPQASAPHAAAGRVPSGGCAAHLLLRALEQGCGEAAALDPLPRVPLTAFARLPPCRASLPLQQEFAERNTTFACAHPLLFAP